MKNAMDETEHTSCISCHVRLLLLCLLSCYPMNNHVQMMLLLSGYLMNNDVPMYIANCCGEHFFIGCLDEVRTLW